MWYQNDASPGAQLTITVPNCSAMLNEVISVDGLDGIELVEHLRGEAYVHTNPGWVTSRSLDGHDAICKRSSSCNHRTTRNQQIFLINRRLTRSVTYHNAIENTTTNPIFFELCICSL